MEWISVNRQLPNFKEHGGFQLIYGRDDDGVLGAYRAYLGDDNKTWYCRDVEFSDVTHWMPLPALPGARKEPKVAEKFTPQIIRFNYYPGGTDHDYPERYEERMVGGKGVTEIKEHAAQGEGDKWFWDVCYDCTTVERIFNPHQVFYSKTTQS